MPVLENKINLITEAGFWQCSVKGDFFKQTKWFATVEQIRWVFGNNYRNDPKFMDRQAWANSADPDQTAPRGAV